jgi:hypothetical protein
MLLTKEQMKYLETDGNECFRFVDDGKATKSEKEELLKLDEEYFEIYQHHIITNLEDLKN